MTVTLTWIVIASLPALAIGVLEDVGYHQTALRRMAILVVACVAAIALTGVWLPTIGIPLLDAAMGVSVIGIPVTIFAVVGMANAYNMVDGLHGLAGFASLSALVSIALIARSEGLDEVVLFAALLAACVLGFLLVNFPLGLIFLGDAGAYAMGFLIAWLAIVVVSNSDTSPWALLLCTFWPFSEAVLTIARRNAARRDLTAPDAQHVHQLLFRRIRARMDGSLARWANPLASIFIASAVVSASALGVSLYKEGAAAFAITAALLVAHWGVHRVLVRM